MKLKHKNVIQLKEAIYSSEKERMFIVLQYCSKGSLITVLNAKLTTPDQIWMEEVRGYFRQMVDAIAFSTFIKTSSLKQYRAQRHQT